MLGIVKNTQKTKKIIFILLSILIISLLIEFSVRTYWERPVRTYEEGMLIKDENAGFTLNPGFQGHIIAQQGENLNISVSINSKGLRDEEALYSKPENLTRIVIIGDTVTFGTRVPYEKTFSYITEKELQKSHNSDVINLGVPAYEPIQEYIRYNQEGYKYNPDIVVMVLAMNDILYSDIPEYKSRFDQHGDLFIDDSKIEKTVKDLCHTCILVYSLYNNRNIGFTDHGYLRHVYHQWENETAFNDFSEQFVDFNSQLKQENVKFILVMYPYVIQMSNGDNYGFIPQQKVSQLAAQNNITFVDMSQYLNNKDYEQYFTSDGRIASSQGHAEISKVLVNMLNNTINQEHK